MGNDENKPARGPRLNLQQVADQLGVSRKEASRLTAEGEIPYEFDVYVYADEVEKFQRARIAAQRAAFERAARTRGRL